MQKLRFFSEQEFQTVNAFAGRIIPAGSDPKEDPGAIEVGSAEFVDIMVARRDSFAQEFVKESIDKLDVKARQKHGKAFFELNEGDQDKIIEAFLQDESTQAEWNHLRKLVLYGYHSNYVKEGWEGRHPWQITGYLGPVTWPQATTEMINRHYQEAQEDKTFT